MGPIPTLIELAPSSNELFGHVNNIDARSAMSRRRKQSPTEDLVDVTARLPWWAGLVLAVVSYAILHYLATGDVIELSNTDAIGSSFPARVLKAFASIGQYLIPLLFILGASASGFRAFAFRKSDLRDFSESELGPELGEIREFSEADPVLEIERAPGSSRRETAIRPRSPELNVELLNAIDWKRFEEVCAAYFRGCGFDSETQPRGPDGGIDIRLFARNDRSAVANIVQCKQRNRGLVGPEPLRELLGVMTANGVPRGTFVTSSRFTEEACQFASENRIYLVDGKALVERMRERSASEQEKLLAVAIEGDYLTPSCPGCGIKLVERSNGKDNSAFWGCRNFPVCRYTMRRKGGYS